MDRIEFAEQKKFDGMQCKNAKVKINNGAKENYMRIFAFCLSECVCL